MDVVHERCAGLDVHKDQVVACVVRSAAVGVVRKTRTFKTTLPGLEALRDWLLAEGCTQVVMEATGVYWKPVYNVLEGHCTLLVVNPQHVRALAGRKTDVKDAGWLADLLRYGLVTGSFIPDRAQRERREVTRSRTALIRERAREVNRLQKTLEAANIKLGSVLSDITGRSGLRMLAALLAGEADPAAVAALAHGKVQRSQAELAEAVMGQLTAPLRFVVEQQLAHLAALDRQIAACDTQIAELLRPFDEVIERLDAIPGIGRRTAEVIVAELGTDLGRFPSADHLAAWAGVAPGNRQSGGKRYRARSRKGNPWLKGALTEAAWAVGRCKTGSLGAQYRRLAKRLGRKRAVVAVAHSLVVILYHMLTEGTPYQELDTRSREERQRQRLQAVAVRRLEQLGFDVTLTPRPAAA